MNPQSLVYLALANFCFAAQYLIDASCRSDDALFNGLVGAVQEGIDLADNALSVMTDHADDQWVQKMAKYVLGTDGYDDKFARARDTFGLVKGYDRDPTMLQQDSDGWRRIRSNSDVEIYCGVMRFNRLSPDSNVWVDGSTGKRISSNDKKSLDQCYDTNFVLGSGVSAPKAVTYTSNVVDLKGWRAAKAAAEAAHDNTYIPKSDFSKPRPSVPNTMDICTWFTTRAAQDGWPTINAERVELCKTDDFRNNLKFDLTPIDGLKTIGSTMLHELTHTNQGGLLVDTPKELRPPGVTSCYNWKCVGQLKDERNADSIAILGIGMKLWSLGHYADEDGIIHAIP
ncbi:hypothetical protein F5Y07DRAFT_362096 [Xylaria sp. FL0933]|nr:hypothetical protein F5Y07DRAFT_362096 [Xylaria sp. FL0933]